MPWEQEEAYYELIKWASLQEHRFSHLNVQAKAKNMEETNEIMNHKLVVVAELPEHYSN